MKIVVIGAVNVDICGTSAEQLVLYDSNPGRTNISFGGVGRNIAENLCRLGEKVDMITVLGDDEYSKSLIKYSNDLGIDFTHSMYVNGRCCSTYISINNSNGDMILAVSDMDIYELLTVDFIAGKMDVINEADIVILDTNLPEDVIDYVAAHCTAKLVADPVSTKKAEKLIDNCGSFFMLKPNLYEAQVLAGINIDNDSDIREAAAILHSKGVKRVFITLGEDGVYYSDEIKSGKLPILSNPEDVKNVTGCGDSFLAAACWSMLHGGDICEMAKAGLGAAAICASSEDTISNELNAENLKRRIS